MSHTEVRNEPLISSQPVNPSSSAAETQNLMVVVVVQVWKISLQGSGYLSLLMVAAGLLWGQMLGLHPTQTVFISSCLSLSSTPLVSRFLAGGSRGESKEGELCWWIRSQL